jgi:hypothetical protein
MTQEQAVDTAYTALDGVNRGAIDPAVIVAIVTAVLGLLKNCPVPKPPAPTPTPKGAYFVGRAKDRKLFDVIRLRAALRNQFNAEKLNWTYQTLSDAVDMVYDAGSTVQEEVVEAMVQEG